MRGKKIVGLICLLACSAVFMPHMHAMQNITQWCYNNEELCESATIGGLIGAGSTCLFTMGCFMVGVCCIGHLSQCPCKNKTLARFTAKKNSLPLLQCLRLCCLRDLNITKPVDQKNRTLAHYAAKNGNLRMMKYLTSINYWCLTKKDTRGRTPLILAIIAGAKATPIRQKKRYLPLIVFLCDQYDATDLNHITPDQDSAMSLAIKNNFFEAVKILVDNRALVDNGLDIAIKNNFTQIAEFLLSHHRFPSDNLLQRMIEDHNSSAADYLLDHHLFTDYPQYKTGKKAITLAATGGHVGILNKLYAILENDLIPDDSQVETLLPQNAKTNNHASIVMVFDKKKVVTKNEIYFTQNLKICARGISSNGNVKETGTPKYDVKINFSK